MSTSERMKKVKSFLKTSTTSSNLLQSSNNEAFSKLIENSRNKMVNIINKERKYEPIPSSSKNINNNTINNNSNYNNIKQASSSQINSYLNSMVKLSNFLLYDYDGSDSLCYKDQTCLFDLDELEKKS